MNAGARWIVAGVLLFFAWRGASLNIEWPPAGTAAVSVPQPSAENLKWAEPLREILPKMTPKDRKYVSNFYSAVAFILLRDSDRDTPIISDTTKFEAFQAGSLRLAIARGDVGKYEGLGEAIDLVYIAANGADPKPVDDAVRSKLVAASGVLSWVMKIHGE
jgi:hypothetical protein